MTTRAPRSETQRLVGKARLLRRTGRTYGEIRATLRVAVSDDRLKGWLRGIPRPPETRRSRALLEQRRKARRMRSEGATYNEIAKALSVSMGTLSPWLSGIPGPDRERYELASHLRRIQPLGAQARREQAEQRRDDARCRGAARVAVAGDRELYVIGVALYWAEGTKDKPWRRMSRVTIINGDLEVVRVFLAWLDLVGVPENDRQYRLNIHESADVGSQEAWWAQALGVSPDAFSRATLKSHRPTTVRRNVNADYHGCLTVSVRRSRRLYDEIEGAWRAIARSVADGLMVETD